MDSATFNRRNTEKPQPTTGVVSVNGQQYTWSYREWKTWSGKPASGYSVKMENGQVAAQTFDQIVPNIKYFLREREIQKNLDLSSEYRKGVYNGD